MDDLIFRAGEVKRLQHTVTADEDFAVTAVTCSIYDADGVALVNGAAGTVDSVVAAEEHAIPGEPDLDTMFADEFNH